MLPSDLIAQRVRALPWWVSTLLSEARAVEWLLDLPSAGDTAFPSVARAGAHRFLIANYSSPLEDPQRTWISGQLAEDGTQVSLFRLDFLPR